MPECSKNYVFLGSEVLSIARAYMTLDTLLDALVL